MDANDQDFLGLQLPNGNKSTVEPDRHGYGRDDQHKTDGPETESIVFAGWIDEVGCLAVRL